jgi:hypothetical protein
VKLTLASIQAFAKQYAWLADPTKSKNRCVDASMTFLNALGVEHGDFHRYMTHNHHADENNWHAWVKIGNLNIDWTARQYFDWAEFPSVWLD